MSGYFDEADIARTRRDYPIGAAYVKGPAALRRDALWALQETTGLPSGHGWNVQRVAGLQGRSDNMIKLRGVNVYPTAIAAFLHRKLGVDVDVETVAAGATMMFTQIEARQKPIRLLDERSLSL